MSNLSPAEQKVKNRHAKSIIGSVFTALLIIATAFVSTFFEFSSLASKIILAALIVAATLFVFIFIVRYFKNMDEYEKAINANASMVALFSSMLLLPWSYLDKIGLLPELNLYYAFMFMWFVYVIATQYFCRK